MKTTRIADTGHDSIKSAPSSSSWSGSVNSMRSAYSEASACMGGPIEEPNMGRSIILSGVRENQWENLLLIARHSQRDRHSNETGRY